MCCRPGLAIGLMLAKIHCLVVGPTEQRLVNLGTSELAANERMNGTNKTNCRSSFIVVVHKRLGPTNMSLGESGSKYLTSQLLDKS